MPETCPYPGLRAFFTEERDWYFGREAHVDAMLTCLESGRFLAVVGSSGSGKSSLVFAGLIPALREGQLAGSRRDDAGAPAPWDVVSFHPGNEPIEELAAAICKAARRREDPHLAGYIRAALDSGDLGLIEALRVAGLIETDREVLVYADQFEELFRFGEKSSRAAQEKALRFARLLVAAAEQTGVRLHLLLSMRSEFIGECERFPGLPEIVSRSQFLTPRLSSKQLEQSLASPAAAVGWSVSPDALTAILNDCGTSPDQLPLAQHVLRRMWMRAADDHRTELTLGDYDAVGGIRNSVAAHGNDILEKKLPQPAGPEVARVLFMVLCEQREDGPLVRRLTTREEAEAIAGENRALIPELIAAFGGDDPGFIREDKGWLDVRHEAVLRQWPKIAEWRIREAESEAWLRELSQATMDYEKAPETTELWRGNDLRGFEEWMRNEKPSKAWAERHSVWNWDACLHFIEASRTAAIRAKEEKEAQAREAREDKERRQKNLLTSVGAVAAAFFLAGLVMTSLWNSARRNEELARKARQEAEAAAANRLAVIQASAALADQLAAPILANGKSALAGAEQQILNLAEALGKAATELPPDHTATDELVKARQDAENATDAIEILVKSIKDAAGLTGDGELTRKAEELAVQAREVHQRRLGLQRAPNALQLASSSIEARLKRTEAALAGLLGRESLDAAVAKEKDPEILVATAEVDSIAAIQNAAFVLGFTKEDFSSFSQRLAEIGKTLTAARNAKGMASTAPQVAEWPSKTAVELLHADKVNRVRFAPKFPADAPLIVCACEDRQLWFWRRTGGKGLGVASSGWSPMNCVAISPKGDAAAGGNNGAAVFVLHWTGPLAVEALDFSRMKADAFRQHSDAITDVEFSHGGEQIASASGDRTVRVFDSRSLKQNYYSSPPLPGIVTSVAFHPRDNLVVSGCDDGGVRLHTIKPPGIDLLGKMDAPARSPGFSVDGKLVIAASGDRTARVWQIDPREEIAHVEHPAPVTRATFRPVKDPDGYTFVTTATNGEVRAVHMTKVTATSSMKTIKILEPRHPGAAVSATWSTDGRRLATVGGGEVLVWEWAGDAPVARVRMTGLHPATSRAEFSPDANLLVTYGGDHVALVWDLTKLPASPP